MRVLSIQSHVAYGHVGNSAAVFPLQRLGHEVWPVLTVHFSNHTGYGAWRGPLLAPADVAEVIAGIADRGVLGSADAVLSGYQGDPAVGAVILDAVDRVKAANPDAERTELREAAKRCFDETGISPRPIRAKLAELRECRQEVREDHPTADKAELRRLVMECVRAD